MIYSKDMSSAYPAVMLQKKFPMTKFIKTKQNIDNLLGKKALLIDCRLKNLKIKTIETIPYIASAKKTMIRNGRYDNGRVLMADEIGLVLTDIDYQIIKNQYDFEPEFDTVFTADYKYLPKEFRKYIFDRYIMKCNLKGGDKYLYAKEKNKINANFGMCLTDIVHDEIVYHSSDSEPFEKIVPDIFEKLKEHYNSYNTFLVYQWGLWVTAWCRYRLQKAIDGLGSDIIYCDTDSTKYFGNHDDLFTKLNNEILQETSVCGFNTEYTRYDGEKFSLGLWEDDGEYTEFITLGSKKYGYVDTNGNLGITVAGLSKKKGSDYLKAHHGLKDFRIGTIIPPSASGRTTAHYHDVQKPYRIEVYDPQQKRKVCILNGSSLAIENVPYTFGISSDYEELLEELDKPIFD